MCSIVYIFKMHFLAIRAFCFLIGLIEVNVFLVHRYFLNIDEDFIDFCKQLAFELMHTVIKQEEQEGVTIQNKASLVHHKLITSPVYTKWNGLEWVKCHKRPYQQLHCSEIYYTNRTRSVPEPPRHGGPGFCREIGPLQSATCPQSRSTASAAAE